MREGKLPDREADLGRRAAEQATSDATAGNRYNVIQNEGGTYSTRRAASWLGIGQRRIRQIAAEHKIGSRNDTNHLIFTFEEITIMGKLTRKGRMSMKNVTPRKDPEESDLARLDEDSRTVLRRFWNRLSNQVLLAFHDHTESMYHRIDKARAEAQKEYRGLNYETMEIWSHIKRIEKLLGIDPVKKKEGDRGRAASELAGTARLTLVNHADKAA